MNNNNFLNNTTFSNLIDPLSNTKFSKFIDSYASVFLSENYKIKGVTDKSLVNPYTKNNTIVPFIFNSTSKFKTEHINFYRENLQAFNYLSFQPSGHPYHKFIAEALLNKDSVSTSSIHQFLSFLSILYMIDTKIDLSVPLNPDLFLICKELKNNVIRYSSEIDPNNIPEFLSSLKHGHRTLQIKDEIKHSLYSFIEKLISHDKNFVFSHLLNINVLYKMGLPLFTDIKHFHPMKEETVDKIINYSQLVNADAKDNPKQNPYFFSQKEPNSFNYISISNFFETLFTISEAHLSNEFKGKKDTSFACKYTPHDDENYQFENIVKDFLSHKDISQYLKNDFDNFTKKQKSDFFTIQQYMDVHFPLIYETFNKTLYVSHPYLKPVYWDNIIAKIRHHRFYISEPLFSESHIPISIEKTPLTINTLIHSDTFHQSLTYQDTIQQEIFELDQSNLIESLLNAICVEKREGLRQEHVLKKFEQHIYPIIRENHLLNVMKNTPKNETRTKRKI